MKMSLELSKQELEKQLVTLTKENSFYKTENFGLQNDNHVLQNEVKYLKEQVDWFTRQLFGKRSEKIISEINYEQLTFEGFEVPANQKEDQIEIVPAHKRRKPNRNGQDKITLPPNLPVETIVLDISEEQKICKETGVPLVKIGEEITHKLAHKPGSFYIKEFIRPKYAIPNSGILTDFPVDSIIPKCRADESFLAEILTRKFADHLPLYRISESLGREGIGISRKLLSQWVVRIGNELTPLRDEMLKLILKSNNIFVDETPVKFLEQESRLGYIWTICGGESSDPPYRVYIFSKNRCYDNILKILKNYRGALHSDKYGCYQKLAESKAVIWMPCWAHIRRKFFESESGDPPFRQWVLEEIHKLFSFEEIAWTLSPEDRFKIRMEKEEPIIDLLIERVTDKLMNGKILPKSKLNEALNYFFSLIPYMKNYLKYPFARLDNNVAERAIRPIAIGRKNWLFFGSQQGGDAGSTILSLVQTCRGIEINPREYMEDTLCKFPRYNNKKLYELLPDQWKLHKNHT